MLCNYTLISLTFLCQTNGRVNLFVVCMLSVFDHARTQGYAKKSRILALGSYNIVRAWGWLVNRRGSYILVWGWISISGTK